MVNSAISIGKPAISMAGFSVAREQALPAPRAAPWQDLPESGAERQRHQECHGRNLQDQLVFIELQIVTTTIRYK